MPAPPAGTPAAATPALPVAIEAAAPMLAPAPPVPLRPGRRASSTIPDSLPSPILKWAGGKRQLLPEILAEVDRAGRFRRFHEPFIGGGAVFFEMSRLGRLGGGVTIADVNPNLIDVYEAVKGDVKALICLLTAHQTAHTPEFYYAMRGQVPDTQVERAARVIYLNKTCFNGLYRENSKGKFNVPIGDNLKATICNPAVLLAASLALQPAEILCTGFASIAERAEAGDLVYFDPPYVPLSATSSFAGYAKGGFGPGEQEELAGLVGLLTARGVKVILSNSMNQRVRELYAGVVAAGGRIGTVMASRSVNSKGGGRGAVEEALVSNF